MSGVVVLAAGLSLIAHPVWVGSPDAKTVERVYPARARAEGRDGGARVSCNAAKDGSLGECSIIDDAPPALGFGAAALTLARDFRIASGQAPGRVRFRLRLHVDGGESPGYPLFLAVRYRATWPPPDPDGEDLLFGACPGDAGEQAPHGCQLRAASWTIAPSPGGSLTQNVTLECRLAPAGVPTACRAAPYSGALDAHRAEMLARGARLDPSVFAGLPPRDVWVRFTIGPPRPASGFGAEVGE